MSPAALRNVPIRYRHHPMLTWPSFPALATNSFAADDSALRRQKQQTGIHSVREPFIRCHMQRAHESLMNLCSEATLLIPKFRSDSYSSARFLQLSHGTGQPLARNRRMLRFAAAMPTSCPVTATANRYRPQSYNQLCNDRPFRQPWKSRAPQPEGIEN